MNNEQLRETDNLATGGVKYDAGKARMDLVPVEGIAAVAAILGHGAKKYAPRNWEKGMDWSRPYAAALRHLFAWFSGEKVDPDSGYPHLWHVATNIFFLIAYEARNTGNDDRPSSTRTASTPPSLASEPPSRALPVTPLLLHGN